MSTIKFISFAFLITISLGLSAQNKGWGNDTIGIYDTVRFEAKEGVSMYLGTLVTEDAGFEFNTTTLFGKGKVKLGFNLSYVYSHFRDTIKSRKQEQIPLTPFGAIGFGITSRVYSSSNQVHLTTNANYMISMADSRFKSTNGISLKLAVGVNLNEYLFLQAGLMAQTYLTTTNERPTNASFTIGLGATL